MALRDIAGQEGAVRILLGTLGTGRIPSAMLLSGDAGIGKRMAAISYGKALNCREPDNGDCCDRCPSCRKIDMAIHPDVTVVSPENDEIRIEAVRRIADLLSLKALEGSRKVVVIDDADRMNTNAANAFLKTLEEPPEQTVIMLVSSRPDTLPGTIASRCMPVRFHPLPLAQCGEVLRSALGERYGDDLPALTMGRPGLALAGDLRAEKEWFLGVLDQMLRGDVRDGWADRAEMRSWLEMCLVLVRDLAVYGVTGSRADVLFGRVYRETDLKAALEAYRSLERIKSLVDMNLNKLITWNCVAAVLKRCVRQ